MAFHNPLVSDWAHRGGVSRTIDGRLFGLPNETLLGLQTRYDAVSDSLNNSFQRQFLFGSNRE